MSSIQISLKIAPSKHPRGYNKLNVIPGSLRIVIGNTVVTKHMDEDNDHGYRGGFIYHILIECVGSIPRLFAGKRCKVDLIDGVGLFIFTPQGNLTYVKNMDFDPDDDMSDRVIRIDKDGKDVIVSCDSQNRRYPDYPIGTPVPTILFAKEIIRVGEEFLNLLELNRSSDDEHIIKFCDILLETKDYFREYLISHSEGQN